MNKPSGRFTEQNKLVAKIIIGLWLGLIGLLIAIQVFLKGDEAQYAGLVPVIYLLFLTPVAVIALVWLIGKRLSSSVHPGLRLTGKVILWLLAIVILGLIIWAVQESSKQTRSNRPIPKAQVLQMISDCQIRQVRFEGKTVNIEYFKNNNAKYQKHYAEASGYTEYVDAARAVADTCHVRYFNMVLGGGNSKWGDVEEAKQLLLACEVSRLSPTTYFNKYEVSGVETNILIHAEGYRDALIEVSPGVEYDQLLALKPQVDATCGIGATRWLKLGENAYQ